MATLDGQIKPREIVQEMQESYLDYAMSVIVARALPDIRDGLKPVHRRILYAMHEMGLRPGAKYRKSATIIGKVLGSYHPHGDTAAYDSMVRMAQDFSLRYPLVDGQGNFGSVDADPPAAYRYCLAGDQFVLSDKGLVRIKEIAKGVDDVEKIEHKVLSFGRKVNLASKWFDSGEHPTLKVTTFRGFSLQGTHNHPILVWAKDEFSGEPKFKWKLLGEIETGDIAVIDRSADLLWPKEEVSLQNYLPNIEDNRKIEKKALPETLDENLAYLLGLLTAEGTLKEKEIEFCNADPRLIEEFESKWRSVFPDCRLHKFDRKPNSYGKKPYQTVEIHSQHVIRLLYNIGLSARKSGFREVPILIFQSPKNVVAAFLRGCFDGDGTVTSSRKMADISYISISEKLIDQIQLLLLRCGIAGIKRFDKYRSHFRLQIRTNGDRNLFQENIGFFSSAKKDKLSKVISEFSKRNYSATDFIPFLKDFVYSALCRKYSYVGEFVRKHNFDRYPSLQLNYQPIVAALRPDLKLHLQKTFKKILEYGYLFDPIVDVKPGGIQRVYSIRVDSTCHSFVANGFINHNTEAKMAPIAEMLLADIDKETVDFVDNYDGTTQEPTVLPARIPNLLLNGSMGIAVGMATNIPPHNLGEVLDGLAHLIDNPEAGVSELNQFIKGPDFPTGGTIYNEKDILNAYATGKGPVIIRAKADIVESERRGFQIVVTEIPYQVNKAELIIHIAELVKDKKVDGIKDVRDESDKDGLRIAVDLKQDAFPRKVLNQLFKYTELQKTFHFNVLGLVDGIQPQILGLKSLLEKFIEHRRAVVTRRARYDLTRAQERAHILEGLKKALDHIDDIIKLIKKSESKEDAFRNLIRQYKFSDRQTNAILEMRLQALAGLERKRVEDELKEKKELIVYFEDLLAHPKKILGVIKQEFQEIKNKYADERRTKIVRTPLKEIGEEELIPEQNSLFMVTRDGYIKRIPPETLKSQKRGGKGLIGMTTKEEDIISHFFVANTHDNIMFFTNSGKVFLTKGYEVPESTRQAKGKALVNFLQVAPTDKITAVIALPATGKGVESKGSLRGEGSMPGQFRHRDGKYLVMTTANGIVKKVAIDEFSQVRRSGMIAIKLRGDDELKWVKTSSGLDEIILTTTDGQAIRFKERDIRPMGRAAAGVIGIRLEKIAKVIGADVVPQGKEQKTLKLLVVMAKGYGKRTELGAYKVQKRGGKGIMTAKLTAKTGDLISAHITHEDDKEVIAVSQKGQVIKTQLESVSILGRATQGVRIMKLDEGDAVASVVVVV